MCEALKELMKEEIQEARQEAVDLERVHSIKCLMQNLNLTADQAMEALSIPLADQKKYTARMGLG